MNFLHQLLVFIKTLIFHELIDRVLDSFLRLENFLNEHFWAVFWVVTLGYHAVVLSVVDSFNALGD